MTRTPLVLRGLADPDREHLDPAAPVLAPAVPDRVVALAVLALAVPDQVVVPAPEAPDLAERRVPATASRGSPAT